MKLKGGSIRPPVVKDDEVQQADSDIAAAASMDGLAIATDEVPLVATVADFI